MKRYSKMMYCHNKPMLIKKVIVNGNYGFIEECICEECGCESRGGLCK